MDTTYTLRGRYGELEERILKAMKDPQNKHLFYIIYAYGGPFNDFTNIRYNLPSDEVVFRYSIDGVHVTMSLHDNRPPYISCRAWDDPWTRMPPPSELRKEPAMIMCDQILRGDARNWEGNVPHGISGWFGPC